MAKIRKFETVMDQPLENNEKSIREFVYFINKEPCINLMYGLKRAADKLSVPSDNIKDGCGGQAIYELAVKLKEVKESKDE